MVRPGTDPGRGMSEEGVEGDWTWVGVWGAMGDWLGRDWDGEKGISLDTGGWIMIVMGGVPFAGLGIPAELMV